MNLARVASATLCLVAGCIDTTLPAGVGGGQSVCSTDDLIAFRAQSSVQTREDLWIAFVDVGHGDAIWVRTPGEVGGTARDILFDVGDDGAISGIDGLSALRRFMSENEWLPGSPIDALVVTNPDYDHYGGARGLMSGAGAYDVRTYVDPAVAVGDKPTYDALIGFVGSEVAAGRMSSYRPARTQWPPHLTELSDGLVRWKLLASDENAASTNDASIVVMLEFVGVRVLLTGDAETPLLSRLAADPNLDLQANVLKVPHHGSADSSPDAFLDRVFPAATAGRSRFAIVSAGRRTSLPAESALERLVARVGRAGLYRTDRGDEDKSTSQAPGDDHILMRITAEGDLMVGFVEPEAG